MPLQRIDAFMTEMVSVDSTALGDAANAINTTNKYSGRQIYNSTINKGMGATGATATDTWIAFDDSLIITPA